MEMQTKIQNVKPLSDHTIQLEYIDGITMTVDLSKALKTPVLAGKSLQDIRMKGRGRTIAISGVEIDVDTFRNPDSSSMFKILKQENTVEQSVGAKVARLLEESGISQVTVAKRIGTSQPAVARMASREYTGHTVTQLQTLARALGKKVKIEFVDD